MDIFQVIILGIIEGLTEFLPVSSTFHLITASTLLGIEQTPFQKVFEVAIQSGAILAVIASFTRTVIQNPTLIKKVIVAFIPTAGIGFLLYKVVKDVFLEHMILQLAMFIAMGIIFILFERFSKKSYTRSLTSITYKEAFLVGIAQSLAVIPGTSRAGAVMLALMFLSVSRKDAAAFSFLLAVPTILAASLLDVIKSRTAIVGSNDISLLILGSVVALVTAFLVVKWFLRYLEDHTLSAFGWYRIILGLLLILIMFY